jgi:hypothetical protein
VLNVFDETYFYGDDAGVFGYTVMPGAPRTPHPAGLPDLFVLSALPANN